MNNKLDLQKLIVKELNSGKKIILEIDEWVNKSSGRCDLRIIGIDHSMNEIVLYKKTYYIEFKKNTKKLKKFDYATEVKQAFSFEEKFGHEPIFHYYSQVDNNFKLPLAVHILKWAFKIKNVELLIIGDGPLRKSLEKETKDLDLDEHIKFLGFREDIPVLIHLSDIIILSTHWEALGLVSLEAGACKKPIVASDVDGPREAVIDGKTGFLFRPGSAKELSEKILELYHSEELRKKMGKNGYQFVLEKFNKERMIKEYKNLYYSLL